MIEGEGREKHHGNDNYLRITRVNRGDRHRNGDEPSKTGEEEQGH